MITDFGLSRMISYSQTILATTSHNSLRGSARWMAYELVIQEMGIGDEDNDLESSGSGSPEAKYSTQKSGSMAHTKASDVWAFGMIIYVGPSNKEYCYS